VSIKQHMTNFLGNSAASNIKKEVHNFIKNCAKYGMDPEPDPQYSDVGFGTGSGINSSGSVTLFLLSRRSTVTSTVTTTVRHQCLL
jgi:hypothetical protein